MSITNYDRNYIKEYIKQNEGFKDTVYLDTEKIPTINIGVR